MKVFIATFIVVLVYLIDIQVIACMKSNDIRKEHLGTRTPYRFKSNKNDSRIKYPYCKDSKIWMVIRHGTRLPNPKDISAAQNLTQIKNEILLQHSTGKGQLTKKQLKQLQDWYIDIPFTQDRYLTYEGQDEMILLAERMQKRFPNAIPQNYNNETFLFRFTPTQRTHQSARYFTNGLFKKKDAQKIAFPPPKKVDRVLRFYKHCDKWLKQVKKNPETYKEQELYGISQEMNKTLESVSKRLGLNRVLKLETVSTMYKFCGYETAWHKQYTSPWCSAFDDTNMKTLEYYYDLKTYWLDGYGYELTYKQACISIKHMFDSLSKEDYPNATFLFTHSGTILKLLTHLGLYKPDRPLTGTNLVEDRKWKSSEIDSFGANLAFVLFKCKDDDRILTLHQENIIRLPMCSEDLCPLKTMMDFFHDSIHDCNYDEMCRIVDQENVSTQVNTRIVNIASYTNFDEL